MPDSVPMPLMDVREENNSAGLAAAIGMGRISRFQNISKSGIYPTLTALRRAVCCPPGTVLDSFRATCNAVAGKFSFAL